MGSNVSVGEVASDAYKVYDAYQTINAGKGTPGASALSIAGTAVSVGAILSSDAQEEQKAQAVAEQIGLCVADAYTFGLASVAVKLCDKYCPALTNALRKFAANEPIFKAVVGLFDTDKWQTEGNRIRDLVESGVNVPVEMQGRMHQTRGLKKEELFDYSVPMDFRGFKEDGTWVNNVFTESRNESDLRPQDIMGYAAFFEKFGNDWMGTFSPSQREAIAAKALELGAVREHHGTIDITWPADFDTAIADVLKTPTPPPSSTTAQSQAQRAA